MKIDDQSNYSASRLDLFANQLLAATKTTGNDYLIVEPYSIGDAVHTLSLVSPFRKKHCAHGEKIHFLCNERALPIVNIFRNVDYAVGANLSPHEYQLEALAERYGPVPLGRPIPTAPDMYARGWLGKLGGAGLINAMEAKKLILELDMDANPYVPELAEDVRRKFEEKARAMGLSSGSVIIFNHANTMRELDERIFRPAEKVWGDNVFYDATLEGRGAVSWAKPIKMRIDEIPFFASFAGSVICIRSGITDLLACSDANVITLYPNQSMLFDWSGDRKKVKDSFRQMTLNRLGLGGRCTEYPLFCEDDDSVEIIADRLSHLLLGGGVT